MAMEMENNGDDGDGDIWIVESRIIIIEPTLPAIKKYLTYYVTTKIYWGRLSLSSSSPVYLQGI